MQELGDKQLKIGLWWVTHKHQLKRWWVRIFVVADVLLFLYLLFNVVLILFTWTRFNNLPYQIAQQLVDFKSYQRANAPQNIQVVSTKIIPVVGKTNTYHLLAELKNPNQKWAAPSLVYHFILDGNNLEEKKSFILPQEEHFVIQYNVESDNVRPTSQFFIDDLNWRRVERPEDIPTLNFEISNTEISLIPLLAEERTTSSSYSTRVTAEIRNNSVYNFWQVRFLVLLYRGTEPVAVNELTLEKFLAQETKDLAVSWKEAYPGISKVTIVPEVNVLDPNTVFEPQASSAPPLF